jgi:hypothetical protein
MSIAWQVHAMIGERGIDVTRPSWAAACSTAQALVNGALPAEADRFCLALSRGPNCDQFFVMAGEGWRVMIQRLPDRAEFVPGEPLLAVDDTLPNRRAG